MSRLLLSRKLSVSEPSPTVAFERTGSAANPDFDRYLTVGGSRAYHLGTICDTCEFVFERLDGANQNVSAADVSERLRAGLSELDEGLLQTAGRVLPPSEYRAMLLEVTPELVRPGEQTDYFTHEQVECGESTVSGIFRMTLEPSTTARARLHSARRGSSLRHREPGNRSRCSRSLP